MLIISDIHSTDLQHPRSCSKHSNSHIIINTTWCVLLIAMISHPPLACDYKHDIWIGRVMQLHILSVLLLDRVGELHWKFSSVSWTYKLLTIIWIRHFDTHGSVHHNTILIKMTNKMQLCRIIHYSIVPWLLYMFRAIFSLIIRSILIVITAVINKTRSCNHS